jgi:hypothetical protein
MWTAKCLQCTLITSSVIKTLLNLAELFVSVGVWKDLKFKLPRLSLILIFPGLDSF